MTYGVGRANASFPDFNDDNAKKAKLAALWAEAEEVLEVTANTSTCKHCGRSITNENGSWVDPEATGDDSIWRESCDSNGTFTAEHEPTTTASKTASYEVYDKGGTGEVIETGFDTREDAENWIEINGDFKPPYNYDVRETTAKKIATSKCPECNSSNTGLLFAPMFGEKVSNMYECNDCGNQWGGDKTAGKTCDRCGAILYKSTDGKQWDCKNCGATEERTSKTAVEMPISPNPLVNYEYDSLLRKLEPWEIEDIKQTVRTEIAEGYTYHEALSGALDWLFRPGDIGEVNKLVQSFEAIHGKIAKTAGDTSVATLDIYMNVSYDSTGRMKNFMGYDQGDNVAKVYTWSTDAGEDKEALEKAFRTFNIDHPSDYRGRSLSVGDVVYVRETDTWYACQSVGWDSISPPKNFIDWEGYRRDLDSMKYEDVALKYRVGAKIAANENAGLRRHKLMTQEVKRTLPSLYSQESNPDPMCVVKYFSPYTGWKWYGIEFDGQDTFFGWVQGFDAELGYFSLSELEMALVGGGVPAVERDLYWTPSPLSEVKSGRTAKTASLTAREEGYVDGYAEGKAGKPKASFGNESETADFEGDDEFASYDRAYRPGYEEGYADAVAGNKPKVKEGKIADASTCACGRRKAKDNIRCTKCHDEFTAKTASEHVCGKCGGDMQPHEGDHLWKCVECGQVSDDTGKTASSEACPFCKSDKVTAAPAELSSAYRYCQSCSQYFTKGQTPVGSKTAERADEMGYGGSNAYDKAEAMADRIGGDTGVPQCVVEMFDGTTPQFIVTDEKTADYLVQHRDAEIQYGPTPGQS